MRALVALDMPDVPRSRIDDAAPGVRLVDPHDLVIDDSYQRGLSDRSIRLIRKIVAEWSWLAFKPPIVVDVDGELHVIDGQHTVIGAVTHGGVSKIPVLVVEAEARELRASAFVRHNRDRIQVTPTQLHMALVAAGDEDALTIAQVCQRAGVTILKNPPPFAKFRPGDTMAISTIEALVSRRHAQGARRVLEVCVQGGGIAGQRRSDPRRRAPALCQGIQGRDGAKPDLGRHLRHPRKDRDRSQAVCGRAARAALARNGERHLHEPEEGAWMTSSSDSAIVLRNWKSASCSLRRR
ncbi:DUF6551 family protein [Rhizobium rhizogenes]|uniref:DUF6551 family protein n=1 Tax=Rhizobium rhizogenes TaxID=359 RepID=UPI001F33B01E|nr:DUF6551 family protein [Rhizobium rhizogenes]